jgi:hypothetical protein
MGLKPQNEAQTATKRAVPGGVFPAIPDKKGRGLIATFRQKGGGFAVAIKKAPADAKRTSQR